jgi:hypothetical protein
MGKRGLDNLAVCALANRRDLFGGRSDARPSVDYSSAVVIKSQSYR